MTQGPSQAWKFGPAAAIVAVALACYLPFGIETLYHSDSIGFARSITRYDLALHQPHLPGYPVYVLVLRLVHALTGTSNEGSVLIVSMVATVATALMFFALSQRWLSRRWALGLTMVFLTSPVVWFNADITMSYPMGMCAAVAVALACAASLDGARFGRVLVPLAWGVAAGVRQDVGLMMTPLVLYSSRDHFAASRRYVAEFVAIWAAAVVSWLVPLLYLAGGVKAYVRALSEYGGSLTSLGLALRGNVREAVQLMAKIDVIVVTFLIVGTCSAILFLISPRVRSEQQPRTAPMPFLLIWVLSGLGLHTLTTIGHSGYVLSYLPGVLLLLATARKSGTRADSAANALPWLVAGAAVALNAAFFLLMPQESGPFAGHWRNDTLLRDVVRGPTRSRISHYGSSVAEMTREVRANFPADRTILLGCGGFELPFDPVVRPLQGQARYYLQGWRQRVLQMQTGSDVIDIENEKFTIHHTTTVGIPAGTEWVVLFCDPTTQPYGFGPGWTRKALPRGAELVFARVDSARVGSLTWGPFSIGPPGG